jgi:activator of HSP90 ATPase
VIEHSFEISATFPVSAEKLYLAWLDSKAHSAFTGGKAKIQPKVGGKFTAWDEYILGTTIELEPYRRIVQSWRTTEFPQDSPDSRLEILFEEVAEGTKLTLKHSRLPRGQAEMYRQGWIDYYFEPMKTYFSKTK